MTTVVAQVPIIRRLLNDDPLKIHLNGAIANATEETVVVDSTDIKHVKAGQVWEHDTGELRLVISVDIDNSAFEAYRGHKGTTAASTHADDSFMSLAPRFEYATIEQAINTCLDSDLYPDIYEIQTNEYTSSATTYAYNIHGTGCEKLIDVYQRPVSTNAPKRTGIKYTVYPQKVDTDLWAGGYAIEIYGGVRDGTDQVLRHLRPPPRHRDTGRHPAGTHPPVLRGEVPARVDHTTPAGGSDEPGRPLRATAGPDADRSVLGSEVPQGQTRRGGVAFQAGAATEAHREKRTPPLLPGGLGDRATR